MDTLEALAARIETTRDLQSIVRTMKSLAAAGIRQHDQAASSTEHYAETVRLGLRIVLRTQPEAKTEADRSGATGVIVIGSDHGLCGRFNEQIVHFARSALAGLNSSDSGVLWLALGLRAGARLDSEGISLEDSLPLPSTPVKLATTVHSLLLRIDEWQRVRKVARLVLFHNARRESETASPQWVQMLPLDSQWLKDLAAQPWKSHMLPTFTMGPEALLASLIRQHLFVTLYRAVAASLASEHASRLAAMQIAERHIDEHLAEVITQYHHRRQEAITEELLDISAGFEVASARA